MGDTFGCIDKCGLIDWLVITQAIMAKVICELQRRVKIRVCSPRPTYKLYSRQHHSGG